MHAEQIRELLPVAFQIAPNDEVLDDLLEVMQAMHEPVEAVLGRLDEYADPRRCPPTFVPYLAAWVGLGWLVEQPLPDSGFATGLGRLRELVARAADLARLRGTVMGLEQFLGLLLGTTDVVIDESRDRPFHATVTVPGTMRRQDGLIRHVLQELKPAHMEVDLAFADEPPSEPADDEADAEQGAM